MKESEYNRYLKLRRNSLRWVRVQYVLLLVNCICIDKIGVELSYPILVIMGISIIFNLVLYVRYGKKLNEHERNK
jgi:hypothetical protein